ncbi:branched-chain amino acid transport system permease protein [Kineococcus xinjiangensis]|uniref:Branched-chain amino acid transport system permease protein n=1 Tax=Kineococcus xinjiangensis TaxID=512762 RepID=A0A2S6IPC6_9ACTN|nr:branched-chain amino acid ABC transporter permease [Kineococcus xinjiangensis]PPK96079.1 branched-chain amino acid transport system permease protein [Kineococcus xinjiangensis]
MSLATFLDLTLSGLVVGAIYALFALGYTLVYGVLRLINFAHSEVFMWGSFAAVWLMMAMGARSGMSIPAAIGFLLLALIAAMAVSGAIALVVEKVAYSRLRHKNAPPLVALISAIGASFVLAEIMGLRDKIAGWVGLDGVLAPYVARARDTTSFPNPLPNVTLFEVADFPVRSNQLIVLFAALIMMVALDQFVRRSRLGRGVRAVSQDPEAAALMGINRDRVIQLTFLLGGLMAGAAALLYLMHIGVTRFNVGFILGIKAFTAAVLGGIGNIRGALLGGLTLGLAENYGSLIFGTEWKDVVAFCLLIVVLLFRPTGLLGESLGKARA